MKNISIIFAANLSSFAFEPVINNKNSIEMVIDFAENLPDTVKTVIFTSPDILLPKGFEIIEKKEWTAELLINTFANIVRKMGICFLCLETVLY